MQAYTGNFETNYLHIELEPVPLNHEWFHLTSPTAAAKYGFVENL